MVTAIDNAAFERGIDPIFNLFTVEQARALVQYRADERLQQRIAELAEKSTEGELSESEQAEYAGYVRANKFVAILQARARQRLADSPL